MNKVSDYTENLCEHARYHIEDVVRIVSLAIKEGYYLTCKEAYDLWISYSDKYAASWLVLDRDEEVVRVILRELEQ